MDLKTKIRDVPDFPKKGIIYKDITPALQDPESFRTIIEEMTNYCKDKDIDVIACAESRGFIFGGALAHKLGKGFVMLRKPGKLPYNKIKQEFDTEYSTDAFEIHTDALKKGDKVLIVDDLLATGGTSKAAIDLIEKLGGEIVSLAFLIELGFLNGRDKLKGYDVFTIINYE